MFKINSESWSLHRVLRFLKHAWKSSFKLCQRGFCHVSKWPMCVPLTLHAKWRKVSKIQLRCLVLINQNQVWPLILFCFIAMIECSQKNCFNLTRRWALSFLLFSNSPLFVVGNNTVYVRLWYSLCTPGGVWALPIRPAQGMITRHATLTSTFTRSCCLTWQKQINTCWNGWIT